MGLQEHLDGWTPAPTSEDGVITAEPVAALSAVLDRPVAAEPGDPLPPLWHWLHLLAWPPQQELGPDGHPMQGRFLPPIPDRRRMFAGGRVHIARPLEVGAPVHRTCEVVDCTVKHGTSGEMVFVTVRSTWSQQDTPRVTEDIDYVYRSGDDDAGRAFAVPSEQPEVGAPWQLVPDTSPVTLFRFSALTANAHRIHYDLPYARDVEGYPGLVVHGPLLVLLMLETVRRAESRTISDVRFRLRRPVFSGMPIVAAGGPAGTDPAAGTGRDGAHLTVASAADDRHAVADVGFAT